MHTQEFEWHLSFIYLHAKSTLVGICIQISSTMLFFFLNSAGSLLRPYISPQNYWILMHHEIFQAYYYGEAMNVDKNTRDKFRDHPHFSACEEFCGRWDEISFDPNYESLPLSEFEPMVIRLLERKPYSMAGQLEDRISQAKASLNNYDFDHWQEANDTTVNSA